ncbi:MAG: rod-binding protein [Verrucomicrobia bacterium]|nr:rod-binding protein [Verrucomicrobiota bacterium]
MHTDPLQRRVNVFDLPLDRLAHNPNVSEPDKRRAAARAFEAVLLRQILADAQKPVLSSALSPETSAKAIYRDLLTSQLADGIARSGQFGLARSLESAWQHQTASASPPSDAAPPLPELPPRVLTPRPPPLWCRLPACARFPAFLFPLP